MTVADIAGSYAILSYCWGKPKLLCCPFENLLKKQSNLMDAVGGSTRSKSMPHLFHLAANCLNFADFCCNCSKLSQTLQFAQIFAATAGIWQLARRGGPLLQGNWLAGNFFAKILK